MRFLLDVGQFDNSLVTLIPRIVEQGASLLKEFLWAGFILLVLRMYKRQLIEMLEALAMKIRQAKGVKTRWVELVECSPEAVGELPSAQQERTISSGKALPAPKGKP